MKVWVYAEADGDKPHSSTLELVTKARELGDVEAVHVGKDAAALAGPLGEHGVTTLYGHMSRFAANLRVGSHVRQGEVIGYVGMTGLATGPHLHYEYLANGVHLNPQTVELPPAEPLSASAFQKFRADAAPLLADLTRVPLAPEPPIRTASAR